MSVALRTYDDFDARPANDGKLKSVPIPMVNIVIPSFFKRFAAVRISLLSSRNPENNQ